VEGIDSRKLLAGLWDAAPVSAAVRGRTAKGPTPLFVVASPRPRTGKTFLARLVVDFLRLDGDAVNAFDLNPIDGSLADLLPHHASRAEIGSTHGQMALFDRLIAEGGVPKVIDLGSDSFARFFQVLEEIDFLPEAARHSVEPVIFYCADPHPASSQAYCRLRGALPEVLIVPVFNDAIAKGRKLRDQFPFIRAAAVPLQIPVLPPTLKLHAGQRGRSFKEFHGKTPAEIPAGPAAELRAWTRRVFLELRELELRLLLEKLRGSLRR
jgi:hypothetical protein